MNPKINPKMNPKLSLKFKKSKVVDKSKDFDRYCKICNTKY